MTKLEITPNAGCTYFVESPDFCDEVNEHLRCPVCKGYLPYDFPNELTCKRCGVELIRVDGETTNDEYYGELLNSKLCAIGQPDTEWKQRSVIAKRVKQNRKNWRAFL